MVLSIGMIVKNEEKYLERCLAALVPILENLDSELIIADTGSTDNTVEIAKKFADKVYHFEWINDFSAARNFTLEMSDGDWFMYIDADEILENCDDIIHFFKSGEHLKYSMATYIQRSFTDMADMGYYNDFRVVRLAKRYDDLAFVSPIHEAFSPTREPIKHLDIAADHYGYMFRNNNTVTEQALEKSKRNLELLLKGLNSLGEGEVPEYGVYSEIADCYEIINNDEKAFEYVKRGLDELDHTHPAICAYYSHGAALLLSMKRYYETIALCTEYFGKDNPSRRSEMACDINIYAMRADAHFRLEHYSEAISDLTAFFGLFKKYLSNRLNTPDLLYGAVKVNKSRNLKALFEIFFKCCSIEHRYNTAAEYVKAFPIDDFRSDHDYMLKHICFRVELMENTSFKELPELYEQLDDSNRNQLIRIIRWRIFKLKGREDILNGLIELSKTHKSEVLTDTVNIYRSYFLENSADAALLNEYITKYGVSTNTDILCIMLDLDMDITPFITAPRFDVRRCVHSAFTYYYPEYMTVFSDYDADNISSDGLAKAAEVYGRAMVESQKQKKDISKLFRIYGSIGKKWLGEHGSAENAAPDIMAAVIVSGIISARDTKDYKLCINEMRRLIKTFPEFSPIVKEYQEIIKKEVSPANSGNSKLAELATVVKANIRNMIRNGKLSAAESTLSELEKLCPSDPDIGRLRTAIADAAEGSGNIH